MELHGRDTRDRIFFYEHDFYPFSNFSAFAVEWEDLLFPTSEHLYHYLKFSVPGNEQNRVLQWSILNARSAHIAFEIAQAHACLRRPDWDEVRVPQMRSILFAKVNQHQYVSRKLMNTGYRELIEDSWRDSYWGWGPDQRGLNMLGRLWMEVRALRR